MSNNSIQLQNLVKIYSSGNDESQTLRLRFKDFTFESGSSYAIIGSSGSGKTTLLHLIAGLTLPDSGQMLVSEAPIFDLKESHRDLFRATKIGYVFQTFNLLNNFSALENVMLATYFAGLKSDKSKAIDLLQKVGLGNKIHNKPSQLSMGQQQRVAIARALINDPSIILADEPTGNLDPQTSTEIMDLIMELTNGKTFCMVTHDHDIASRCDHTLNITDIVEESR